MNANNNLKLENQLCFKLYSISRSIVRLYGPLLKEIDLTYPQYLTMMVLWESDEISFKELSYRLKMKTGTLTPIVSKLEEYGYIKKYKDENDDRKIYIHLTTEGKELQKRASSIPTKLSEVIDISGDAYLEYMEIFENLENRIDEIEQYVKL